MTAHNCISPVTESMPLWQQLQFGLLIGKLKDWREADHEDAVTLCRSDVIAILDAVKALGVAQAPVLSDAWCDAFLKATGEWIEAHEAETECGVPMECEITQADADEFNAQAREAIRKGYAAAVTSTDKAWEDRRVDETGPEYEARIGKLVTGTVVTSKLRGGE